MEYSKPAATSLLGTTNVVIVEKIFVKNPLIHKGMEITKTLNNNWPMLSVDAFEIGIDLITCL